MFAEFSVQLGAAQAGEEQGQREFSVGLGAIKAGEDEIKTEVFSVFLRGFCPSAGPLVGLKFSSFP